MTEMAAVVTITETCISRQEKGRICQSLIKRMSEGIEGHINCLTHLEQGGGVFGQIYK